MKLRNLSDICVISQSTADDGMPEWANLVTKNVFSNRDTDDLAGGGIYACFWDDLLIYIGSFVGPPHRPFAGHVGDRVNKHVIGFTFRSRKLGFAKRPLLRIIEHLNHKIADDLQSARASSNRVLRGDIKATYNKACFAKLHWEELRNAAPEELLNRFSFLYRRLPTRAHQSSKPDIQKRYIKPAEVSLIRKFNPTCNTLFRTGLDGPPAGIAEVAQAFEAEFTKIVIE